MVFADVGTANFVSRGPASAHDFAKWSGLTLADARHGIDAVKGQLASANFDGTEYWFAADAGSHVRSDTPRAFLLSIFDELISSYKDRSAMGDSELGARLMAMDNDLTYIIVVDGQIVGTWKRSFRKTSVAIALNQMTQLTQAQETAVQLAAQRYGAYFGLQVTAT